MVCQQCRKQFEAKASAKRKFCTHECYRNHRWDFIRSQLAEGLRCCSKCKVVKTVADFYSQGKNAIAGWCKECRRENERQRRADTANVLKFHKKYETDMDFRARELLRAVQKRCRREGYTYDLDSAWMVERLTGGSCELTGLRFNMSVATRRPNAFTPSIDRINAGGGYTKGNCRLVLHSVNAALGDWGLETVIGVAEALVRRNGRRVPA